MKIVNGYHRGYTATMLGLDESSFSVSVKLENVIIFISLFLIEFLDKGQVLFNGNLHDFPLELCSRELRGVSQRCSSGWNCRVIISLYTC